MRASDTRASTTVPERVIVTVPPPGRSRVWTTSSSPVAGVPARTTDESGATYSMLSPLLSRPSWKAGVTGDVALVRSVITTVRRSADRAIFAFSWVVTRSAS